MVGERPTYCALHKLGGMIDVKHKRCVYEGCDKTPSYANPEQKIPTHCSTHKTEAMVNVKHKKCEYEGCDLIPSYNFPNEKTAKYCKKHKLENMVDISHKRCHYIGCLNRPIYNFANESLPLFCVLHKTNEMIDVYNKKCVSEWCVNRAAKNNIYEDYCLHCFIHLFPEKPTARNYKTKEQSVVEHVKENFPDFTWVCDRRIADGCSRRRPDLLLDLGFQVIIVEVDENQHIAYECSCENRRLMELSQDVGHRPIVFIRFNPDDYILKDGTKVKTCWSVNKTTGTVAVDKNNRRQWNDRLATLIEWITYWSANKTNKVVEVVQLFFDE
jgi:hypothetical protein